MIIRECAVDLDADLGESYGPWRIGDDEALLSVVTSANIASGFHVGDPLTIRRACAAAIARGVSSRGCRAGGVELVTAGHRA